MEEQYKNLQEYPDVLNPQLVAKYLNVSKDSVRKLCVDGKLKHVRIGRLYKITKLNLVEFLQSN